MQRRLWNKPGRGPHAKPLTLAPSVRASLWGSQTILLVKNGDRVRALIADVLRRQGYEVLEAAQHQQAIWIAQHYAGGIDLLMTDLELPGMDGRELAKSISDMLPRLKVLYADNRKPGSFLLFPLHHLRRLSSLLLVGQRVRHALHPGPSPS